MDMKDLVLSTLSYLEKSAQEGENSPQEDKTLTQKQPQTQAYTITEKTQLKNSYTQSERIEEPKPNISPIEEESKDSNIESEDMLRFLTSLRERILVLFEGLQSPNNRNIEAKIDLILNFLEYQLSIIDNKVEELTKEEHDAKTYS